MPLTFYTHPHAPIEVEDISPRQLPAASAPSLHRPVFFIQAEKGQVGKPFYGVSDMLIREFGESIFDSSAKNKFYHHQNVFLEDAASFQEVAVIRVADDTAKAASLVLQLTIETGDVIQYEKDAFGKRVLDSEGDPIPLLDTDGITPITETGIIATWSTRELLSSELPNRLQPSTTAVGGVTKTTYPIMVTLARSPGAAINNTGFRLYYNADYDKSAATSIGNMLYTFKAMQLNKSNNPIAITDRMGSSAISIALSETAIDEKTNLEYGADVRIRTVFTEGVVNIYGNNTHYKLPYDVYTYDDSVIAIAEAILDVSPELTLSSSGLVNILTGVDETDTPYDHYLVNNATDFVNSNRTLYLMGGSDGAVSKTAYEDLVEDYLTGEVFPAIQDYYQYPFTHLYDSGFRMSTKRALIRFTALRDDVKITLSTQDAGEQINTMDEDLSIGMALQSYALLFPESTYFSTQVARVEIYQQAHYLNNKPNYRKPVPYSLWRLNKRCQYEATDIRKGIPKMRPASEVTMFQDAPWTPVTATHRELSWYNGINYCQYGDRRTIFYPDLRTVHPVDNSILSSSTFTDAMVYVKHNVRYWWTVYAGAEGLPDELNDAIIEDVERDIFRMFGGTIVPEVSIDTAAAEYQALGYRRLVRVKLSGDIPNRTWDITITVDRRA